VFRPTCSVRVPHRRSPRLKTRATASAFRRDVGGTSNPQFTARRNNGCYDFGKALARAVKSWPKRARVAFIATGGLSHFCLDEEFDRNPIAALQHKDQSVITSTPPAKLKSGSGEIRNWIALAGAMESLNLNWSDYIPCYRSSAGTGTGIAFAIWE
jgi:hypothetical protein